MKPSPFYSAQNVGRCFSKRAKRRRMALLMGQTKTPRAPFYRIKCIRPNSILHEAIFLSLRNSGLLFWSNM